ncbi:MAG: hypothetical protein AAFQ68_11795, partial [Bacteroidota bacterium]
GNAQKWLRDDGTIAPTVGETLDCNSFTVDRVLTNGPATVDYVVPSGCVLDITAALTIEPGTVIEFEENAGIGVYDNGTIKAIGTESEQIVLRGTQNVQGYWRGIHIETNSLNNRFENLTVQNAGANYVYCCNEVATIFLKDGKLALKNVTVAEGGAHGIYARSSAEFSEYSNVTVTTHKETPLLVAPNILQYLDGETSDYTGNDQDFIEVLDGDFTEAATIKANNVAFLFPNKVLDVKEAIEFEAGTDIFVSENGGIGVFDNGALKLSGTASANVLIRGKEPVAGYWRGIHMETSSLKNQFSYAQISEAGSDYVYCCNDIATVFLKAGKLAMDHTTLLNGDGYGLLVKEAAELREYQANTITSHNDFPIYIHAERIGELDGSASDYSGNVGDHDYVAIFTSTTENATTFPKNNVPYLVITNTVLNFKEPLKIDAGVEVVFEQNAGMGIYDNGTFNVIGTASEKIIFRGRENVSGYWRGIHTETTSSENRMDHVELRNAASNYVYCCNDFAGLLVKSGTMEVTNSYIADNDGCGIFVKSGGTLTEAGNTFANNTDGNICQ